MLDIVSFSNKKNLSLIFLTNDLIKTLISICHTIKPPIDRFFIMRAFDT